jgi:protein TonB
MRRLTILALGVALAWSSAALAAKYPLTGTEADPVYWTQKPTGEDIARVYPPEHIDGRAVIRCKLDDQGLLADCVVIAEEPAGHGFGEAALKLSGKFRAQTKSASGKPSAGLVVELPVRLQVR